jgi:hypothetical protein
LVRLVALLEDAIAFVVAAAGQGEFESDIELERCILTGLCIDQVRWAVVCCPSIAQYVCLKHLQSLFLYLEEQLTGDALDAVCEKYKHTLSRVLQAELREALPAIQKESCFLRCTWFGVFIHWYTVESDDDEILQPKCTNYNIDTLGR